MPLAAMARRPLPSWLEPGSVHVSRVHTSAFSCGPRLQSERAWPDVSSATEHSRALLAWGAAAAHMASACASVVAAEHASRVGTNAHVGETDLGPHTTLGGGKPEDESVGGDVGASHAQ